MKNKMSREHIKILKSFFTLKFPSSIIQDELIILLDYEVSDVANGLINGKKPDSSNQWLEHKTLMQLDELVSNYSGPEKNELHIYYQNLLSVIKVIEKYSN